MRKKSELSDLTENPSRIFVIIILAVVVSLLILIVAKIYQDRTHEPTIETTRLTLESDNFPTLQLGHYALWSVLPEDQYTFLKRFNSVNNQLVSLDGSVLTTLDLPNTDTITRLAITIEREGDRDEKPNNFVFMHSTVEDDHAKLEFNIEVPPTHNSFLLATPSDGNLTINELSGIWFINEDLEQPSLNLPELENLPFIYQAGVINTQSNQYLTIGKFRDYAQPDDFQSHTLNTEGFNLPGEDFLRNLPDGLEPPLNLTNGNYQVIISLEPFLDGDDFTGEDIFLELFKSEISTTLPAHTTQILDLKFRPITLTVNIDGKYQTTVTRLDK